MYARSCRKLKRDKTLRRLFLSTGPFQFCSINLLRHLPKTRTDNHHIMGVRGRLSKLTRATYSRKPIAVTVTIVFINKGVVSFRIRSMVLGDNRPQVMSNCSKTTCKDIKLKRSTTTKYYHNRNGQLEWFNVLIVSRLSDYVTKHQQYWDSYVLSLPYAKHAGTTGTESASIKSRTQSTAA